MSGDRPQPITVTECVHCGGWTICAESDTCACGNELYPVSKIVAPGTRIYRTDNGIRFERPAGATASR